MPWLQVDRASASRCAVGVLSFYLRPPSVTSLRMVTELNKKKKELEKLYADLLSQQMASLTGDPATRTVYMYGIRV